MVFSKTTVNPLRKKNPDEAKKTRMRQTHLTSLFFKNMSLQQSDLRKKRKPSFALFFTFVHQANRLKIHVVKKLLGLQIWKELVEKNFKNRIGFKGPSKAD